MMWQNQRLGGQVSTGAQQPAKGSSFHIAAQQCKAVPLTDKAKHKGSVIHRKPLHAVFILRGP